MLPNKAGPNLFNVCKYSTRNEKNLVTLLQSINSLQRFHQHLKYNNAKKSVQLALLEDCKIGLVDTLCLTVELYTRQNKIEAAARIFFYCLDHNKQNRKR